jgi:lactate dehydrogenase-like 2-hydroxyacid dehydrogenase
MAKKKILVEFWIPPEVNKTAGKSFSLVFPKEEITGQFSAAEVKSQLKEVEGFLAGGIKVDRGMIDAGGGSLKVIGRHGVGCDSVDYIYAGEKGIPVINTPNAVTQPTAELSIAILLDTARNVTRLDKVLRKAKKCAAPPSFQLGSANLFGKTLGIIGFGRIGKAVGFKARGLGMKVIYSDPIKAPGDIEKQMETKQTPIAELLKASDFVTLHCPYIPENHHLINKKTLKLMKKTAFLVNASRGKMVDEAALVEALQNKIIAGAALDVYENEPAINPALLSMDNVVLVPHVGTWSYEARVAMAKEALEGMYAYLSGENPPNIFNREYLKK